MIFDIKTFPHSGARFIAARDKIGEFVDYARAAGKPVTEVQVFASDYKALCNAINKSQRAAAKIDAKAQNDALAAAGEKGKVKAAPVLAESLRFGDVTVTAGNHYSRPRPVQK